VNVRHLALAAAVLMLAGCGSGGGTPSGAGPTVAGSTAATSGGSPDSAANGDPACSAGLTGTEPGVVRISCDGTADIRIQVAGANKDIRGGSCQSAGDVWSAAAGVVIDRTGVHGTYAGPPVDSVAVNNTAAPGKATIQVALGGKLYYDLGGAALTLSTDRKTAHLEGTSDRLSDGPNDKITIDVTC
jgi:hypothetical protein